MKSVIMRIVRRARDGLAERGLEFRTIRGREKWRAGVELLWARDRENHQRLTVSRVRFHDCYYQMVVGDNRDLIQSRHLRGEAYSPEELDRICTMFKGGTFVDIGANVGNHAIVAALAMKADKVIAFEPNPPAYRLLMLNVAANELLDTVKVCTFGLSDEEAHATAVSSELNLGATKVIPGEGDLILRRGDDLIPDDDVGFIKIDVEGLEMRVLDGIQKVISRCRPPMLVEVDDENAEDFARWLADNDYRIIDRMHPYVGNENFFVVPLDGE